MSATQRAYMARYDSDGLTTGKTDDELEAYLTDALLFVPVCNLGNRADLALAVYALYLMSSAAGVSGGGAVKREKAGDLEREYAVSASTTGSGNKYLDLYQRLNKSVIRSSPIVLNGR